MFIAQLAVQAAWFLQFLIKKMVGEKSQEKKGVVEVVGVVVDGDGESLLV